MNELSKIVDAKIRILKHLPYDGDLSLIILKGQLLVEELLFILLESISNDSKALQSANLSFHKLAAVSKAIFYEERLGFVWNAIFELNSLRNALSHKLENPDLDEKLGKFAITAANGNTDAKAAFLANPQSQMAMSIEFICGVLTEIISSQQKTEGNKSART